MHGAEIGEFKPEWKPNKPLDHFRVLLGRGGNERCTMMLEVHQRAASPLGGRELMSAMPSARSSSRAQCFACISVRASCVERSVVCARGKCDRIELVIAHQRDGNSIIHHLSNRAIHAKRVRPAIDVIAEEYESTPLRVRPATAALFVTKTTNQSAKPTDCAVNIANDVERLLIVLHVGNRAYHAF